VNKLYMPVGIPRIGKSTWARKLRMPIVSPDAIRLALHGQAFVALAEPFVWAIAQTMVRALFGAGHDKIILDATNTTKKRRDEWASKGWERSFFVFPVDRDLAVERAFEVDFPIPVLDRMIASFEALDIGEFRDWETEREINFFTKEKPLTEEQLQEGGGECETLS